MIWWITALYKNKFRDDFKSMFVFQNVCFVTLFQKSSKQFSSLVLYSLFLLVILRLQKLLLDFLIYTFINLMSSHNLIIFVLTFSSSLTTFRTLCPCFNLIRWEISVRAYNFIADKITRSLKIIFADKKCYFFLLYIRLYLLKVIIRVK